MCSGGGGAQRLLFLGSSFGRMDPTHSHPIRAPKRPREPHTAEPAQSLSLSQPRASLKHNPRQEDNGFFVWVSLVVGFYPRLLAGP